MNKKVTTDKKIEKKGLVVCNIGKGKGKTTAAFGIACRASGSGMNVYILQFVKAGENTSGDRKVGEWPIASEIRFFRSIKIPKDMGQIDTEVCGLGFVGILGDQKSKAEHIKAAIEGLNKARQILVSGKYNVVILDEILSAVEVGLLKEEDVVELIKLKPELVHLVLTGHDRFPKILKLCDTVTDMKMVQHGYYKGVLAQKGVDW